MKRCHATVTAFFCVAVTLSSSRAEEPRPTGAYWDSRGAFRADLPESKPDAVAREKLAAIVPEIRFDDARLSDAIDALRAKMGINIFVNWKSLAIEHIGRETPITLHLKDRALSTALDLVLAVATPDGNKLGYSVDEGVIDVSTKDDLARNTSTRVYDVRGLLQAEPKKDRAARVTALIKFLRRQVEPDSWKGAGGGCGAIIERSGNLIITQTPKNQQRIVTLLEGVHEILDAAEPPAVQKK